MEYCIQKHGGNGIKCSHNVGEQEREQVLNKRNTIKTNTSELGALLCVSYCTKTQQDVLHCAVHSES